MTGKLLVCLLGHAVLASVLPSAWHVPDLTLIGLVLAISRQPSAWLLQTALAGVSAMLWAIRAPWAILAGYYALGWLLQALASAWDLNDLRVEWLVVVLASLAMAAGALWLEHLWSWPLTGLLLARTAVTAAVVPIAHVGFSDAAHAAARPRPAWVRSGER